MGATSLAGYDCTNTSHALTPALCNTTRASPCLTTYTPGPGWRAKYSEPVGTHPDLAGLGAVRSSVGQAVATFNLTPEVRGMLHSDAQSSECQ